MWNKTKHFINVRKNFNYFGDKHIKIKINCDYDLPFCYQYEIWNAVIYVRSVLMIKVNTIFKYF